MSIHFPSIPGFGLPPGFNPSPVKANPPDQDGVLITDTDDLESIPTDDNDTWHLYPGNTFPIPAGTKSLCGIISKHTLIDGGDYGDFNPTEDRTCVVCKKIADDVNDADKRDKEGYR